jgi:flavorubredoxin
MSVSTPSTRIDEIAPSIYRISTAFPGNPQLPAGFTFNQFLIVDDEPVLFHTGMRSLFPLVREAVARVMPPEKLRYVSFSHFEADECGSLVEWLALAPHALPLCSGIGAMVSVEDAAGRKPRVLAEGELLSLGQRSVRWLDTPHLPHGWDSGLLLETTTRTLFCGDLFTQPGADHAPVSDDAAAVLESSEAMRRAMDYYSNPRVAAEQIERLAATEPALLACMHGTSLSGDGAASLRSLARVLGA